MYHEQFPAVWSAARVSWLVHPVLNYTSVGVGTESMIQQNPCEPFRVYALFYRL